MINLKNLLMILSVILLINIFSVSFASASVKDSVLSNTESSITGNKTENMDQLREEILETSEDANFFGTIEKAREYSLPILVALVFLAIFAFLLGIFVPQSKVAGWSLLGGGIVFYVLINYTEKIIGMGLAIVNEIMSNF